MSKSSRRKKQTFFKPNEISTAIHLAVQRDLGWIAQEYDPSYDSRSLYANRQINELLKKYVPDGFDQEPLEEAVYAKFRATVQRLELFNRSYDIPESAGLRTFSNKDSYPLKVMRRARALMHFALGEFSVEELFLQCKHSGGSSVGVPFVDTSIERKWTYPISATARVAPVLDEYLLWDSRLRGAIEQQNSGLDGQMANRYDIVQGSRATTVDKTAVVRRMIAVEPTANMFLQQGLMEMFYQRMSVVGLNVESLPTEHRQLAKESSITGRNATIDFSDASDSVTVELLRYLLPPEWFEWVMLVRCDSMSLDGSWVELPMISTMGNATTFPLETLTFWTLAHAVRLTDSRSTHLFPEWEDLNVCSVFGDDCILPTIYAPSFIQVCEGLGFVVNKEKSFYGSEKFRESCGGDYLAGNDVRPYNLRAPTSTRPSSLEPWLYIIGNSLLKKYISCFGGMSYVYAKELWRTYFRLCNEHKIKIKLVPDFYPDDAGLKIGEDLFRFQYHYTFTLSRVGRDVHGTLAFAYCRFIYPGKQRWDDEVRLFTKMKKFVSAKERRRLPHEYSIRRAGGYVVAKGLTSHWEVNAG